MYALPRGCVTGGVLSLGSSGEARWLVPLGMQLEAYIAVWSTMPPETLKAMIRVEDTRLLMHLAPAFWAWTVWTAAASRPAP